MSATPEFDPTTGYLYTLSIDGDLQAWNAADGTKIWGFNLYARYGVGQRPKVGRAGLRDYGYTTSPLVHRQWLIVEVGDDEGCLMAFDKASGIRQWVSESKDPAGHTGGLVPMMVQNIPCVAVLTLNGLLVARLDTGNHGKTVAQYEWVTDYANNIPTPAVDGNTVLITSAYNHRKICKLEITLSGARKLWEQPYASGVCSPVIHKGNIYWAWDGLRCLDFETGELKWEGGSFGVPASCVVTTDSRLVVLANRGDLALVETADRSPSTYRELARKNNIFQSDVWPHVVMANGRIFCKDRAGNVVCFGNR
jgi:outer membrane protein assembly factor BamB